MNNFLAKITGWNTAEMMTIDTSANWVIALVIVFISLLAIGAYVYHALAWQKIGKNQKYKRPWLAWIPFANVSMILQMGNFHWSLVFLFLIPIFGWLALAVLITIAMWRIFEISKYPGWLALSYPLSIIPYIGTAFALSYIVIIGVVAWQRKAIAKPKKKSRR